jgi:uncharacterized protein YbjT (DUF2867 family)
MTTDLGTVLVIGATGGTGHQAIRGLREQGVRDLVATTRDPDKPSSRGLKRLDVEVVTADLDDPDSLVPHLQAADRVYVHALSADGAVADPREVDRGRALARLAADVGVEHVVYNSADGCDRGSGVPHMEAVGQVEQAFFDTGLPFTALRATLFMEEYWKRHNRPDILQGVFRLTHPPDFRQKFLSVRDLGRIAAMVMADRPRFAGSAIELAADELTPTELATAFAAAQGSPVRFEQLPEGFFAAIPGTDELLRIIDWYERDGYIADVAATHEEFPGCWRFPEFLAATSWADGARTYESFLEPDA